MRLQHLPLAILSLLISLGLWIYVASQESTSPSDLEPGTFRVEVDLRNAPFGFIKPTQKPVIILRANGTPSDIQKVTNAIAENPSLLDAWVDLSNATVGDQKYPLQVQTPKGFDEVHWQIPKDIKLKLDQKTTREINVTVDAFGSLPDGFLSEHQETFPKTVVVNGLASEINEIDRARVLLDLSKLKLGEPASAGVELLDSQGVQLNTSANLNLTVDPPTVTVLAALSPKPTVARMLVSPVILGQPAPGYRVLRVEVEPNQIVVRGPSELLAKTSSIDTQPISVLGLTSTRTFSIKLRLPDGLRDSKPGPIRVTVEIGLAGIGTLPNPSPTPTASPTPPPL